jgi:hypothetical protein
VRGALKIVYLGNSRFPWTTETHLARTLEQMGHRVQFLQEDHYTIGQIHRAARGSDLVIYQRTWGKGAGLTDVWRDLESRGTVTASYHLDLYVGLEREATLVGDPFWSTQYVFTPDGDPASQPVFDRLGINHHWLPPAIVADEIGPGKIEERFAHDVIFVGSYHYHREWPYRAQLIDWLTETYGDRFRRYGSGAEVIRGAQLNSLVTSAKVVVGDSLCPGFTKPYYTSDRPFETIGRGGFLIMPWIRGLDEMFADRRHLVFYTYGDFDELRAQIDYYLDTPHERDRIREAGRAHVAEHHTYTHRLTEALKIMGFDQ